MSSSSRNVVQRRFTPVDGVFLFYDVERFLLKKFWWLSPVILLFLGTFLGINCIYFIVILFIKTNINFCPKITLIAEREWHLFYSIFTRRVQFRERAETARSSKVTLLWFISSSVTHVTTFWVLAASEMSNDCDNVKISTKANTKDFAFFDVTLIVRKIACNKGRTEGSVFGPSVNRWRDCVFNTLPFKAIKIALRS